MGGRVSGVVLAALLMFFPAAALPQIVVEEGGDDEDGEIGWGGEGDVSGGPLDLSHLGKVPRAAPAQRTPALENSPYWGITETELVLVPAGTAQARFSDEPPMRPGAPWPGRRMMEDWDFARAFSFPQLAPGVQAEAFSFFGSQGDENTTVFSERVRLDLYLLEIGVTFFDSVEGARSSRTDMDLDLRIPIAVGSNQRLSLLPGVTFPIDSRTKSSENSSVRFQAIYGFGAGGVGFQARAGFVEGSRSRGLLLMHEVVEEPAILYGGLFAWRLVPTLQVRVEASGEFVTDGGPDRLSLLGGPVFFPFGDPRISLGVMGILEESAKHLEFSDPAWGGLLQAGIGFF